MQNEPVLLCKILEQRFVDDLLHGKLYMRPLSSFVGEENNAARRDPREGQSFLLQGDQFTLQMEVDGEFQPIGGILNIAHHDPARLRANVFCMYALRASLANKPADMRIHDFGDAVVAMRDGKEFIRRVRTAAEKAGHRLQSALVSYIDSESYSGPLGLFRKSSEFSYQCEFRIALLPGTGTPHFLNVGDLTDIAITGTLFDVTEEVASE